MECVAAMEAYGRGGIRTHGTLLTYTHFPGVRLKPLGHPSQHRFAAAPIENCGHQAPRGYRVATGTDRERFELSIPGSPVCRFSRPVPSTTRPPVLQPCKLFRRESLFNPRDVLFGGAREPLGPKELCEKRTAFVREHSRFYLRSVVEPMMPKQVGHRPDHPCLVVPGAEHHALQAREYDCPRAHSARLERHIQGAVI